MVIGNGLIAKRFTAYQSNDRFLIFASGVSNSKTNNPEHYNRELQLLQQQAKQHPDRTLIYFSTCSIYDPGEKDSAYVRHKLAIEDIIQNEAKSYNIFRVSNLAGASGNPNTVLNFFFYHIRNGINFDLWTNACRNIIDIDTAYLIIDHILQDNQFPNQVINIANPVSYNVKDIVTAIEEFLAVKSNYIEIEKGNCFSIDISLIDPFIKQSGAVFNGTYLKDLLDKYFKEK